jgi:hypothetical protein
MKIDPLQRVIHDSTHVILCSGWLHLQKGDIYLLRVLPLIHASFPKTVIVLAGDRNQLLRKKYCG